MGFLTDIRLKLLGPKPSSQQASDPRPGNGSGPRNPTKPDKRG